MIKIKCKGYAEVSHKELKPMQGDLKKLSDLNYNKLKKEILDTGFSEPISVWKKGKNHFILNGHQRLVTLNRLEKEGYEIPPIPISLVDAKNKEEAKRKVLSLASQYGTVDAEGLKEFIADMSIEINEVFDHFEFPDIDKDEVLKSITSHDNAKRDEKEDDVPEVNAVDVSVNPGDIWELGQHRLMCGDATNMECVDLLMCGEKADIIYTDPPYGVGERTDRKSKGRGALAKNQDLPPVVGDESNETAVAAVELFWDIPGIWWGANYYSHVIPESGSWIVWDKRDGVKSDDNADCELAYSSIKKPARVFRHLWKGCIRQSEKDERKVHPTQKPIALAEWCFENYGDPKTVLDLFGGSGSTLIACQKTDRKCFMMEIDPRYCQIIINRCTYIT